MSNPGRDITARVVLLMAGLNTDMPSLKVTSAPATEPVTLAQMKVQVHLDSDLTAEDDKLTTDIAEARLYAETYLKRALITQTLRYSLDSFPCGHIRLPRPPLISVTSVVYINSSGSPITLTAGTDYTVDIYSEPGLIVLPYGTSWPAARCQHDAVVITYVAGYGAAAAVPQNLKEAILLRAAGSYMQREGIVVGSIVSKVPDTIESSLNLSSWGYMPVEWGLV